MSGYGYGEHEPMRECPYCKTVCAADFVDVGVGFQQVGPYHCDACGASEIGPFDEERPLTEREEACGWYKPDSAPGSTANVVGGKHVSHEQMRETYRREFKGNVLWNDSKYVADWWKEIR